MELIALRPDAGVLAVAVCLDLALGDPQLRWHPIRLMGRSIEMLEHVLRSVGAAGYLGGVCLGILSAGLWAAIGSVAVFAASRASPILSFAVQAFIVYALLALRSLIDHTWAVESAVRRGDLSAARSATAMFVARDTGALDFDGCRRAGIESLGENLTDGYVSPLLWYAVGGLAGLVVFKVFSTLDSMVGNRSGPYIRFGWFSARTDDWLNWVPARATWLLISAVASFIPGCSGGKALRVGWRQHAVVPGPNSGWSEAATAGAIQRRLVGPIVHDGRKITDIWIGEPDDPEAGHVPGDVPRALAVCSATGLATAAILIGILATVY